MQTVLVDTDIAIDFLRGAEYAGVIMKKLWNSNAAYLSILSAYELFAGMKEDEVGDTENFINACNIEPVTIAITRKAGEAYRLNRKKGVTSIDGLIYATAVVRGHRIATKNKDHYPDKKILLVLQSGSSEQVNAGI